MWLSGCKNALCQIARLGLVILILPGPRQGNAANYPLRWRWCNPAPHGNNIKDMAYNYNLGLAVQVAERGQIYTSADLDLWTVRDSGVTNALRGVTFLGNRLIVAGENGLILYADSVDLLPSLHSCHD